MEAQMTDGAKIAITGAAGFALFFTVWFTFGTVIPPAPPPLAPPDRIRISIPDGWTFQKAVQALVTSDHAMVDLQGFQPNELAASLKGRQLDLQTISDGLLALRQLAAPGAVREYDVNFEQPYYRLTVRS
jgi:hypothetical protein